MSHPENEMAYLLNSPRLPKRRGRSGVRLHAPSHGSPVNDNFQRTVSFQYLQIVPMTAVFLVMVALLWIIASSY
jgi:hypothetical protein